jgi:hypothetical protein
VCARALRLVQRNTPAKHEHPSINFRSIHSPSGVSFLATWNGELLPGFSSGELQAVRGPQGPSKARRHQRFPIGRLPSLPGLCFSDPNDRQTARSLSPAEREHGAVHPKRRASGHHLLVETSSSCCVVSKAKEGSCRPSAAMLIRPAASTLLPHTPYAGTRRVSAVSSRSPTGQRSSALWVLRWRWMGSLSFLCVSCSWRGPVLKLSRFYSMLGGTASLFANRP